MKITKGELQKIIRVTVAKELGNGGGNRSNIIKTSAAVPPEIAELESMLGITMIRSSIAQILKSKNRKYEQLFALDRAGNVIAMHFRGVKLQNVNLGRMFPMLTYLNILYSWAENISSFASLSRLTVLEMHNCKVSNIAPLARLTRLTELYLSINEIKNISPLAGLTGLKKLRLSANQIRDISPLSELTELTHLWINNNQIRDISPLARLTQLDTLLLSNNPIEDTSLIDSLNIANLLSTN